MGYNELKPEWKALVNRVVMLKHDLMKAKLYASGQLMEPVVTQIGWEIEAKLNIEERSHSAQKGIK